MTETGATEPRPWLVDALVKRPRGGCAWPIGDTADPAFRFCCEPILVDAEHSCTSYCAEHRALAYLPPEVAKRVYANLEALPALETGDGDA